jgi:hypothetical protein
MPASRIRIALIVLSSLVIVLCIMGVLGTMVSLKYETSADDCVSDNTGTNLCRALWLWRGGAVAALLVTLLLIFTRKRRG